jgi:hypothetical protein
MRPLFLTCFSFIEPDKTYFKTDETGFYFLGFILFELEFFDILFTVPLSGHLAWVSQKYSSFAPYTLSTYHSSAIF